MVTPKALCLKTAKNKRLPAWGNMDSLLGDFVGLLQSNTASSVHTVLNTADKLSIKHPGQQEQRCVQCLQQKDKLFSLLEVEGVSKYLQQDQLAQEDLQGVLQQNYL